MSKCSKQGRTSLAVTVLAVLISAPSVLSAQGPGTESGLWTYLGGDAWHTRYTPADQFGTPPGSRGPLWS